MPPAVIMKRMLKVGLTGGLACGKSFVGEALADLGCHLLCADQLGHEVLLPGGEAYEPVVREFGPGILGENGVSTGARWPRRPLRTRSGWRCLTASCIRR